MDDKAYRIYGADLRDRLVPCGNCDFEEEYVQQADHKHEAPEHIVQQLARHEAWIHEIRDSSTRMIAEQGSDLRWMRDHIEKLSAVIDKIDERQDSMQADLAKHNHFQTRLRTLEEARDTLPDEFIPRAEFDGAINSVRENVKGKVEGLAGRFALLMWIVGAGFGVTFTALGFIIWGG